MTVAYPDPPLADATIELRPWGDEDLELIERASADEYVALIEHVPVPYSADAGLAWVERQHELAASGRGWSFAIVDRTNGRAVGGIGIVFRHPPGAAEPGVWVIARERRRGMAERATRLLCTGALTSDTGIERIQATVEPWNVASQRTLEKVGFQREGLLRAYASWHGERRDALLYSLLRTDLP